MEKTKALELANFSTVKEYLDRYLEAQETPNSQQWDILIPYMQDNWYKKFSNPLIDKIFKDSLTVEIPINYAIPFEKVRSDNEHYFDVEVFKREVNDFFNTYFEVYNPIEEAEKNDNFTSHELFDSLNDIRYLKYFLCDKIEHNISEDLHFINIKNNKRLTIKSNTSIVKSVKKALAFFEQPEGLEKFESIILKRSMLVQQLRMDATLVLSIDPMDYFTASDNSHGWSSCFSITNNGGCKASVYSALITPGIIIAYIKGDTPYYWGSYQDGECVANKIWRSWVYIDDNILYVNKNYPFKSTEATNLIYNYLLSQSSDLYIKNSDTNYKLMCTDGFMYIDTTKKDMYYIKNDSLKDFPNQPYCWHDYDLQSDTEYYSYKLSWGDYPLSFSTLTTLDGPEHFLSSSEMVQEYCSCCGRAIYADEELYFDGYEYPVCEECIDECYTYCDCCDKFYKNDCMEFKTIKYKGRDETWCYDCLKQNDEYIDEEEEE